ncbi:hypothetical protein [uncultured Agrobacterium sp.]|uniref:hypothetical protein n=1 Tax=uncultured Agrobacterium sp. TaxID=157277 RepID=UPI002585E932|nr:hypothetical protein [uncultured Agrobacterium sp.]
MIDDEPRSLCGVAFTPSRTGEPVAEFASDADQADELAVIDGSDGAVPLAKAEDALPCIVNGKRRCRF